MELKIKKLIFILAFLLLPINLFAAPASLDSFINVTSPDPLSEYVIETPDGTRNILQSALDSYLETFLALKSELPANLSDLAEDSTHRTVTDAEKSTWNSKQNAIADGTYLTPTGNGSSLTGLTKSQVGLSNVDNTTDVGKPISSAVQSALDLKATTSTLGTAAYENTGAFATAAQGGLADTALQSFTEEDAIAAEALANHILDLDPHTQYALESDLGTAAASDTGDFAPASHASSTGNTHGLTVVDIYALELVAHPKRLWWIEGTSTTGLCDGEVTPSTTTESDLTDLIADLTAAGGGAANARWECVEPSNILTAGDGYVAFSGDSSSLTFRGGQFISQDGYVAFSGDTSSIVFKGGQFISQDGFVSFTGDNATLTVGGAGGGTFTASDGFVAFTGDGASIVFKGGQFIPQDGFVSFIGGNSSIVFKGGVFAASDGFVSITGDNATLTEVATGNDFTENFTYSNGGLASVSSSLWTDLSGAPTVSTNRLLLNAVPESARVATTMARGFAVNYHQQSPLAPGDDSWVSAEMSVGSSATLHATGGYGVGISNEKDAEGVSSGLIVITKNGSIVATQAITQSASDRAIRVEFAVGGDIKVYVDATLKLTHNDNSYTDFGYLFFTDTSAAGGDSQYIDTVVVEAL